jgi:transposase
VNIGLVITPQGYPLYWRVMPGNTTDITTIKDILGDLRQRFGLTECLLVFDRGMVSEDNLQAIASKHLTYVSAMDKDEIPKLQLLPADFQERIIRPDWKSHLLEDGFQSYDEHLVYREHACQSKRYILAFDRRLYEDQQRHRQQLVQKAKDFIQQLNTGLRQAQKSRDPDKLTQKIESHLRKWNMHKVFTWNVAPLALTIQTMKGEERTVGSFEVTCTIQEEILKQQAAMDGITCFVTNQPPEKLTAAETIQYYRRKNKIEEAFQEMKQFLQLRPFYVSREKRIRAHVSICVLGYLLLNAIEQQLRQHGEPLNVIQALEQLGDCLLNRIGPKDSDRYSESITEVTPEQQRLLEKLGCEHVVSKKFIHQLLG